MKANGIEEKKTLVLNSFKRAFDYESALATYGVTSEERDEMEADEVFCLQMKQLEMGLKERIIVGLCDIADPEKNPKIATRLEALKELGRVLYPDRFRPKNEEQGNATKVIVYVPDNGRGEGSATHGGKFDGGTIEEEVDAISKEEGDD